EVVREITLSHVGVPQRCEVEVVAFQDEPRPALVHRIRPVGPVESDPRRILTSQSTGNSIEIDGGQRHMRIGGDPLQHVTLQAVDDESARLEITIRIAAGKTADIRSGRQQQVDSPGTGVYPGVQSKGGPVTGDLSAWRRYRLDERQP